MPVPRHTGLINSVLTHLSITNLTLVNHLELEFQAGMSAITGETGAGKSILLGALGLALGDRADSSLIAAGADRAELCASFDLSGLPEAIAWLNTKALNNDNHCILRRVITSDGRSRAFVNGSAMTLTELKDLSEMLLDIHSQHEHQSLLKKETHRRLLDEFGGLIGTVNDLEERYVTMTQLAQELETMCSDAEEASARVQLMSYQADELNTLALVGGELQNLELEQKRLDAADETRQTLIEIIRLCANENDTSASSQTSRALSLIDGMDDERLMPISEMLESALIQIDEAMTDIGTNLDQFEADPERLDQIVRRLASIYDIARKHKVNPEELTELTKQIQAELDALRNADEEIEALESQLTEAQSKYNELAEKLSVSRTRAANSLQADITKQLQALGMHGAAFEVAVRRSHPGRFGIDDIEFLIATIPGSDTGSLARIASGGELSRISLAIQVITAKTSNMPTLVFDEVDVGVGGATAEVVGSLLRKLGADTQVICVTHLPQVAAQAHQHYVVIKETSRHAASTTVVQLTKEEKVSEIARMLGGLEKTDESITHAEAMMSNNKT